MKNIITLFTLCIAFNAISSETANFKLNTGKLNYLVVEKSNDESNNSNPSEPIPIEPTPIEPDSLKGICYIGFTNIQYLGLTQYPSLSKIIFYNADDSTFDFGTHTYLTQTRVDFPKVRVNVSSNYAATGEYSLSKIGQGASTTHPWSSTWYSSSASTQSLSFTFNEPQNFKKMSLVDYMQHSGSRYYGAKNYTITIKDCNNNVIKSIGTNGRRSLNNLQEAFIDFLN